MRYLFKQSFRRLGRSIAVVILLALFPAGLFAQVPSPETLILLDAGQPRPFQIALDELHLKERSGGRSLQRLEGGLSLDRLRARAKGLAATTGGEVSLVVYRAGRPHDAASRRLLTRKILLRLAPGTGPGTIVTSLPARTRWWPVSYLADAMLVEAEDATESVALATALRARAGVLSADVELARQLVPMLLPNDPLFGSQWHLRNTGQSGSVGVDVNITSVWNNYRGAGIVLGIVDDGLQSSHPDLAANYNAALSYDFDDSDPDPNPVLPEDGHGTACAGLAGARGNNGIGVCGAAYEAGLAGLRLIAAPTTDDLEASAMLTNNQSIHVKNNSWGPADDGADLYGTGPLAGAALSEGARTGRGGRGMIYVFASGNGLENGDNANYNGYANSIYCLTVGAMTDQGLRTSYATPGACLTVSAPSGDIGDPGIVTTDMVDSGGYNPNQTTADFADTDYTKYFAGTSASAPLVSGIVALMLQANPNLGWRDVKEILIRTATKNLPADPEWATNSAGFHFNHFFGAGLVNAQAAVSAALTWTNLAPATNQSVALNGVDLPIPDGSSSGVSLGFAFTNDALRVEHVRLIVDMVHLRRGDIAITLTSPTGMQSRLTELHGDINTNFYSWPLTSVRHWGESSVGTWTATFADLRAGQTGQLISARLELIGAPLNPLQVVDRAATEVDGKANGNGAIDPGETAELRVALQNTATYPFGALYGTLTTATPGVTLLSAGSSFPSLPATGTGTNSDAFVYRVARSVPCGTLIQFTLLSTNASGRWTNSFSQVVGQPADAASSTDTVDSADAPKAVPDLATTLSTNSISLPGDRFIDDVKVSLRLDHTAVGDLQIALVHPDGTEVVIADHEGFNSPDMGTGNCGAGEVRTVFDDQASTPVSSGAAPFAGSYRPDNPLSVFRGKRLNGNWRLRLSDQYSNDSGTLLCWGLQFVSHEQTVNCSVFNPPPVASDLTIATPYQTAVTAALTAGDVDGDPLSFGIVAAPAHGQLTNFNAASGAFTYTPDPDYAGADLFTFQASDGLTNSATAVVHVSVNPTAPLFTGFDHLSDSRFVLHVLAPPGPAYVIETSTNLVDWLPVATNSAPANPFDFVDADAPNYRARFYRVKQ